MPAIQLSELYKHFQRSSGICTDTRKILKDGMYWALKGPNFDGNKFALEAIQAGAKYAVVDNPEMAAGENIFLVEDGLKALQKLANHHRQQFEIPMIAITGSNGKTTTKELTATILSQAYNCHFTKGNLNNHIGVPLTLLAMTFDTEVAIIEMGANHQGEIMNLCNIAQPTHGIITNIGKAHLEGFGGLEGVKKGKSELYKYLASNNGVAFVNRNENFLVDLSEVLKHRRVQYGLYDAEEQTKWLRVAPLKSKREFLSLKYWSEDEKEIEIHSSLIGNYNISNLATAICLGLYFKVPPLKIKAGAESYVPNDNRSQIVKIKAGKIILDAYNANPSSMEKALYNFQEIPANPKWVILGAMKEMGTAADDEHLSIAKLAKSLNFEQVILVGEEFKTASENFGFPWYADMLKLKTALDKDFFSHKQVLIKGSRSIQLEKLIEGI